MITSHIDYTILLNQCLEASIDDKARSLDKLHNAIKNYSHNPNRSILNEIELFRIILMDKSFSRLKLLNCLIDYVNYTKLDDESLIKFYLNLHEDLFSNILFHTKAYDFGYNLINAIIQNHTSKKYVINIILTEIASSIERLINIKDVDRIIPYSMLLEQIILNYGFSTHIHKFITLLSSIKHKDNIYKVHIEKTINSLKMYHSKLSDEINTMDIKYTSNELHVASDPSIYSMLKNFQYAISHPGNIDSNYDFGHSIKIILSVLENRSDDKLINMCYETIEKLAYVKLDYRNQFKLYNYLIKSIESISDENPIKYTISNSLCRIICNYDIRIFRDFLNLIHEARLSKTTTKIIVNSLIEIVSQNTFERNKLLFDSLEDFNKISSNHVFDNIRRLYNTIRELLKFSGNISRNPSPVSTIAKSLSLSDFGDESTNPPLSKVKSSSQSIPNLSVDTESTTALNDLVLDIAKFKSSKGSRPLLINVIENTNNDINYKLSSILELRSKFVCMVSLDLFNCMFDIENTHYDKMSLEACKFWANYIQQDNKCVKNLIFIQENLFHSILVWFYRLLSYRNDSLDVSLTCIIFIMSGISFISTIIDERKLIQDEILYILKILYYIMDKRIIDINTIIDGGLSRIFVACISIADKFPSFFNPFYITLSDVSIDVSLNIFQCFENIVFCDNSIIIRNDIEYMIDIKSQIISISQEYKLVESTNNFYNKLITLISAINTSEIEYQRIPTHIVTDTSGSNGVYDKKIVDNLNVINSIEHDNILKSIHNYKILLEQAEKMSNSIQNYSLDFKNCNIYSKYLNSRDLESCKFNLPSLLSDSLQLTKSMEYSLRNIKSNYGISIYDSLQHLLNAMSTSINYNPIMNYNMKLSSCVSINDTIKMIYNNLLGKNPHTDNILPATGTSTTTFFGRKKQVDITEFIPILKDLSSNIELIQSADFRSMQLLIRMYIYLWYRLSNTDKIDTWNYIVSNIINWPIETICLGICSILRDIDQAYSVYNGKRRKHPLDKFRIDLFKILCDNYINKSKISITQPKNTLYQLKYSMIIVNYDLSKLDDTEGDITQILKIIQNLDTNIEVDNDFLSNHNITFPSYSINTASNEIECDDKIEELKSYISRLNLCNSVKCYRN